MHPKTWLICGALLGAGGVALGAFGSHGLQGKLTPERLATWEIGVRYQLYHACALLAVGLLALHRPQAPVRPQTAVQAAGLSFLVGVMIFSGCLYALCLTGVRILGAIVPIGGVAFILGWILLAWAAWRLPNAPVGKTANEG